jgi:hypothetical protein
MSDQPYNVLFLCTHNFARSVYQRIFTNLPIKSLDKLSLQKRLNDIGRTMLEKD